MFDCNSNLQFQPRCRIHSVRVSRLPIACFLASAHWRARLAKCVLASPHTVHQPPHVAVRFGKIVQQPNILNARKCLFHNPACSCSCCSTHAQCNVMVARMYLSGIAIAGLLQSRMHCVTTALSLHGGSASGCSWQ